MKTLEFDLETNGLLAEVSKIHCIVTHEVETGIITRYNDQNNGQKSIEEGVEAIDSADVIVAHNGIDYDRPVLRKLHPHRKFTAKMLDTIVLAKLIWPNLFQVDCNNMKALVAKGFPKNFAGANKLKAWGYRLGILKGEFEGTDSSTLAAGESKWANWTQPMEDYCVQDVAVLHRLYTTALSKNPSPIAIEVEHDFAAIMQLQEAFGFPFNRAGAVELYSKLCKRRLEIGSDMKKNFPSEFVPTKTPDFYQAVLNTNVIALEREFKEDTKGELVAAMKVRGFKPKDYVTIAGPVRMKEVEFNPGSRQMIAKRFMARGWRPMKFTENGQPQIDEEVLSDMVFPEAKFLLEYLLVDKRIGQIAEGKKAWLKMAREREGISWIHGRTDPNGAATGRVIHKEPNLGQVPSVDSLYGPECRALFGAFLPGYKLVGCDAKGIQLRCLAHFMARYDNGAYIKVVLNGDPHAVNQKAAGLSTRAKAKTFIYAWLFGAGDELIGAIDGGGAKEGRALKYRFLRNMPALSKMKDAIDEAVKARGYLVGLDGRKIVTRSTHSALNFLLQGAEAVIMKKANAILFKEITEAGLVWAKDWAQVLFCHDEFQHVVKEEHAQLVGTISAASIRKAGEFFKFRCSLDGEFKIGNTWFDTH